MTLAMEIIDFLFDIHNYIVPYVLCIYVCMYICTYHL